jgi:hypothetical protein
MLHVLPRIKSLRRSMASFVADAKFPYAVQT